MAEQYPTTQLEPTKDEKERLKAISEQLDYEFKADEKHSREWKETKRGYLKLLINQRKNPKKVGDTLMFSVHQTLLAALYKDRLSAEWMWREEEDTDRADELNALYEFDYDEMDKPQLDYGKYWDATGFGIAIEDWSTFDRDSLTPLPTLWDPLTTYIDCEATSINGDRLGRGAARRYGRPILRTRQEMQDLGFMNLDTLEPDTKGVNDVQKAQQARDDARGLGNSIYQNDGPNKYYLLLQWFTIIDGKRYIVESTNDRSTIVRLQPVTTDYWPGVVHRIYPDPHTLWTPGSFDFTEDKQRARAILQNYGLDAAKFDVLPMWLFDKEKIKNKQQLRDWKPGKFIEGKNIDANSVQAITKPTIHQYTQLIMQDLQNNAEKALATPQIQQGILSSEQRTATEVAEASAGVDNRYSLTAKVFGLSETEGAYIWLDQYKRNFKKIDKKVIRVAGAFGPKPMTILPNTFKFKKDPDVKIESVAISTARKQQDKNNLVVYGNLLATIQGSNMRYLAEKLGRTMFSKQEVDRLLPPTIDEMRADDENAKLEKNTLQGVVIEPTDDHQVHLEIHAKASDTKAKFAHIEAHKKALMLQRSNPELFPNLNPALLGPQSPAPGGPANLPRPFGTPPGTLAGKTAALTH